jgi:serine/threonine protein kinase
MTPERWQKVEEVLQAALDCPEQERAAFLIKACFGDEELRDEASSLIDAHDEAGDFIEQPAMARDADFLVSSLEQSKIDREIGPYKILRRLGGGGMGEVFLAQDGRLDRLVALKILPAYFVSDDMRLRRFQTEARAASALNHANILTIYEVGQFEDVHFIATEYIDGQTIRELIQRESLSLGEVFDIAIQFVSGLAAAHAAGIIHRDIKPENIMRRGDGGVKILDFGIAKLLEEPSLANTGESIARAETEAGVMLGTLGYMSPEQVRGLPVDERTDIWSSGVVLYELLTERRPFIGVTQADTLVAILDREPEALFALANNAQPMLRRIQRIVSKALRKSESERFQTAADMLAELKAVSRDLETADTSGDSGKIGSRTHVSEIPYNVTPPALANLRRYSLLGAVVLLAVIVVGVLFYQQRSALNRSIDPPPASTAVPTKSYLQMSQAEQLAFVNEQEQRISAMMGERPVKLNDEALQTIKRHVDRYAARKNSASLKPGEEDLQVIYERAPPYVPLIANAFAARRIPIIVGIYLPMIESAYRPCAENSFGARGLFQFLPETAEHYGVARADMCDVQKMAPAAAHYIADRMAELGDDSQSMTLVLLSYNSGTDPVLDALRRLRETDAKYERNFWTLFANRDKLSEGFRRESAGYVPAFFAAAIVGENPEAFELQMPALSTLASASSSRKQ